MSEKKLTPMQELLERAAALVGNPATNISGSTDLACDEWQKDYERWRNEQYFNETFKTKNDE